MTIILNLAARDAVAQVRAMGLTQMKVPGVIMIEVVSRDIEMCLPVSMN